jgi:chromosomal replication initiation ATPase DnaA
MIAASRSSAEGAAPSVEGPVQLSAETLWTEVSARLKEELSDGPYAQWFTGASGALEDDAFVLLVRDDFTREWVDGHYRGLVEHAVSATLDESRPVRIVAAESSRHPEELEPPPRGVEGLNHKYTFDSFVIGSSNRFAHAAALAVAEAPAQAYNLLLIDDIQFFEHKERIQEEFFHTFNSLYEAGRQIVISSDRPPRAIATLEARLRSRFEWGLITDIQAPDLETRIAILRKKVKTDAIHVPDSQLLTFIASRISTNIRELEGALTRVVAFSSLTGRPMTVELAQEVLKDVFPQGELPEVSVERIQETVIDRFGISMQELVGDRRSQSIVYPRQVAMYLCRELTDSSLPKIGKKFGGRDHTTVIHATSKIAKLIQEDRSVYNLVQELTARIKQPR